VPGRGGCKKSLISTIPIVFALAVEPVKSGMVASLAKPGGNVTGFSAQTIDLVGKRIEILRELLPELRQLAVIADAGYFASVLEQDEVQSSARKLGIEVVPLAIRRAKISRLLLRRSRAERRRFMFVRCAGKCQSQSHQHPSTWRAITNDARST
jgi:ABC-type uncharacterized transport system substrate-binding protein